MRGIALTPGVVARARVEPMSMVALVKGYDEEAVCGAGGVAGGMVSAEDGGGVGMHARGCSETGV